jgi:diguanylate cyclase (GGDEF)-like protein
VDSPGIKVKLAEQVDPNEVREGAPVSCHGEPWPLLAELEVLRRELAVANRRIVKLSRERIRSRLKISRLETMAMTDVLTRLVNRRRFNQVLDADFGLALLRGTPLSVVMVDVDCFKSYNDTFGHVAGDVVLRAVARLLVKSARSHDVVARYGGDEFAILLRRTDAVVAQNAAERYRDAIASFRWPKRAVTASFGVATRTPSIEDPGSLVEEADRALYHSKRIGRTRVIHLGINDTSETSTRVIQEMPPGWTWPQNEGDHVHPEGEAIGLPSFRSGPRPR